MRCEEGGIQKCPDDPFFKIRREHKQIAYSDNFHMGVGWDEACVKVGGEERLQSAVLGKRVKVSGSGDDENKFFC